MTNKLKREQVLEKLKEAQAKNLPHPTIDQVFEVTGELPEEDRVALETYLKQFCWIEGNKCPCCDHELVYSFEWGLRHGDGQCRYCSYPARYYHFDVGPIKKASFLLPFHPNGLKPVEEKKRGRNATEDGNR